MATAVITAAQELQESFLSAVRKNQEITLHAIKVWVEAFEIVAPKISFADLPFVNQLPKAHDVLASGYDLAEQMLANQRSFAEDVLKVTSPLLPEEKAATAAVALRSRPVPARRESGNGT
jgi:hypothetical protein